MNILKHRPLTLATAGLVLTALLCQYTSSIQKLILLACVLSLGLLFSFLCVVRRNCGEKMICTLLCLTFSAAAICGSYLYFDRGVGEWNQNFRQTCVAEGVVTERIYSGASESSYEVSISEIDGKRIRQKVQLKTLYLSSLQEGDTFRVRGIYGSSVTPKEEYEFKNGFSSGAVGILEVLQPDDCQLLSADNHHLIVQLREVNRRLSLRLQTALGGENGNLATALLLGNRESLSGDTVLSFRRAGISHLLALSGLHVSILIGGMELFLRKLRTPKILRTIIVPIFAIAFLLVSGCALSTLRAVIMVLILYFAFLLQSSYDSITALSTGLALILLTMPYAILDISLWLSFSATYAIVIFSPIISPLFNTYTFLKMPKWIQKISKALCIALLVGIAANCAVLPISSFTFGEISVSSVPATLLLSPLVTIIIITSFLVMLFPGAWPLARCLDFVLDILRIAADKFSDFSYATLLSSDLFSKVLLTILAVILIVAAIFPLRKKWPLVVCPILACSVVLSAISAIPKAKEEVSTVYLQGYRWDLLLFTEHGNAVVVDTGCNSAYAAYSVKEAVNEKHCTEIKEWVLTQYHSETTALISSLTSQIKLRRLFLPVPTNQYEIDIARRITEETTKHGVEVINSIDSLSIPGLSGITCYGTESGAMLDGVLCSIQIRGRNLVYLSSLQKVRDHSIANNLIASADVLLLGGQGESALTEKQYLTLPEQLKLLVFANEEVAGNYWIPVTGANFFTAGEKIEFYIGQSVFAVSETDCFSYPINVGEVYHKENGMTHLVILGGDARQGYMKKILEQNGYSVSCWGVEGDLNETAWQDSVKDADAVILPLPASEDAVHIRCRKATGESLRFSALLEQLPKECMLFGGRIPETWILAAEEKGIRVSDYYLLEELQAKNALPTVEGAIRIAMEQLPVTLDGATVAILGYGRIGSLLADKLTLLGSKVFVLARKERDLFRAYLRHSIPIPLREGSNDLKDLPPDCRIFFNTVPERIFSEEEISLLPQDCIWIELASSPGGIDPVVLVQSGRKYLLASALPGRFYPESAGKILAEAILAELRSNKSSE